MACVTLEDYGRLDNLDEVAQGFQPANLVFFDIRNPVLTTNTQVRMMKTVKFI